MTTVAEAGVVETETPTATINTPEASVDASATQLQTKQSVALPQLQSPERSVVVPLQPTTPTASTPVDTTTRTVTPVAVERGPSGSSRTFVNVMGVMLVAVLVGFVLARSTGQAK
jgi:hypothetical protein